MAKRKSRKRARGRRPRPTPPPSPPAVSGGENVEEEERAPPFATRLCEDLVGLKAHARAWKAERMTKIGLHNCVEHVHRLVSELNIALEQGGIPVSVTVVRAKESAFGIPLSLMIHRGSLKIPIERLALVTVRNDGQIQIDDGFDSDGYLRDDLEDYLATALCKHGSPLFDAVMSCLIGAARAEEGGDETIDSD